MPRLGQRRRDVAGVNHAGVFGPGAVVGQVHPGVADAGQVLQFEHHGLGTGLVGPAQKGRKGVLIYFNYTPHRRTRENQHPMNQNELTTCLQQLLATWENEVVEL